MNYRSRHRREAGTAPSSRCGRLGTSGMRRSCIFVCVPLWRLAQVGEGERRGLRHFASPLLLLWW